MEYSISKDALQRVSDFCSISLSYYLENTRLHRITFMSVCSARCPLWNCWLPLASPTFFKPMLICWKNRSVIRGQLGSANLKDWNTMAQIFKKLSSQNIYSLGVTCLGFGKYFVRSEIFWENLNYLFLSSSAFPQSTFSPCIC